jgi:glycosyltransferase involved in cell wall biosynthesis
VIPTWNRAHTIQRAVDSALRQSLPVLEILVCDDGSTDDTEAVVRQISGRDSRVRWVAGERGGRPAIPRNRGIPEARGDWLAFLDSDDEWHPEKLAVQMDALRRSEGLAVCSNAMRVLPDGRQIGLLLDWERPTLAFADLLEVNRVVCSSCMLHRSLISITGGFPEDPAFKVGEDYVLWLRIASLADFAYCKDALVYYQDDPRSSIRGQYDISPQRQKALVLAATRAWLLNGRLGRHRRILALASLGNAYIRLAAAAIARRVPIGLFR